MQSGDRGADSEPYDDNNNRGREFPRIDHAPKKKKINGVGGGNCKPSPISTSLMQIRRTAAPSNRIKEKSRKNAKRGKGTDNPSKTVQTRPHGTTREPAVVAGGGPNAARETTAQAHRVLKPQAGGANRV